MSGVAASAALTDNTHSGVPRRRLRSVPTQAGPVPERGPAHPLALGRDAQAQFRGAVRALLDAPGLEGMSDAVRLAVIVLASRTPSSSGVVEIRTPELGRWLGLSVSYVASEVVPKLRRSGVVDVETAPGEYGQDIGLKCKVLPMWTARGVVGHPLALAKKELATLLRLLEAVMAPGWAHRDGRVTPAGLLGSRTGRAAATDRLALLLLVLEARENGRVRQCGGTVDTRRGRAAATVARLLGCTVSRGERVLERLEDRGLVVRVRVRTASGLCHRTQLVVPAVAAAHGRDGIADAREDRLKAAETEFSDPALAAGGSDVSGSEVDPQVNGALVSNETDGPDPALTAALHTDHPPVVTPVSSLALPCGCSGEGRAAEGRRPECACAREAADGGTDVAESAPPVAERGPLRGEKPKESGGRPKAVGWEKAQPQRRVGLPADLGLRVALGPVAGLWGRLSGWQQNQVEAAVKAEVKRLAGMLERPEVAPRLLADRLTDRLEETGGEALVDRPFPWLIRRGLVQRQACSDRRCDDGIRLDTGGECENCNNVLHLRRAQRAKIAAEVDRELPGLGGCERRQVLEERLREHTQREAEQAGARHDQVVAEVEMRWAAAARRRAAEEAAALERRSAACVECGLPGAAGLCPECTYRRRTDALVLEAVDLAVAVRADLDDLAQIAALSERCEADTRALLDDVCRRQAATDQGLMAFTAREVAERIRDERRASAHSRLLRSEEAEAEAEAVYDTMLRRRPRGHQTAEDAAEEARRRTAYYLLERKLGLLRAQRARMQAGRAPKRLG
ncbi:hypothetical protein [Streptomyces indiaensis]|uniref:Uncharacterized protein n=1 Tax=Streptomyces indiaensis TaxID=284033 RepID=A0ABN3EDL5_9ACTN|nr:hypothetical protein [Streptomyces indiaensis]MCF1648889.1 hypothetical protein [Streptomyces indiaensis]